MVIIIAVFDTRSFSQSNDYPALRKNKVPFRVTIDNVEFIHDCCPNHPNMGPARSNRMTSYIEAEGKQTRENTERTKVGTKSESSQALPSKESIVTPQGRK